MQPSPISQAISEHFKARRIILQQSWLTAALQELETHHLGDLQSAVLARWLQSDLRQSLNKHQSNTLPSDCHASPRASFTGPLILQIVSCQEIGSSCATQLEQLKVYKERQRPEERRLVHLEEEVNENDTNILNTAQQGYELSQEMDQIIRKGLTRLILEDCTGQRCYGLEHKPISNMDATMSLGGKIVVSESTIIWGTLLLKPLKVEYLGGHIASWNSLPRIERLEQDLREKYESFELNRASVENARSQTINQTDQSQIVPGRSSAPRGTRARRPRGTAGNSRGRFVGRS